MTDVTRILQAIKEGDENATDKLLPLVYEELRLLAAQKLSREKPGQTLQATALVHEAYMRLVGNESYGWSGKGHFFAAAAEAMRRILVDTARYKHSIKHGGKCQKIDFSRINIVTDIPSEDLIALDEALSGLQKEDPMAAELVKMRFFAGLTVEQTACALGCSTRTADRCWMYAKAWLYQNIRNGEGG